MDYSSDLKMLYLKNNELELEIIDPAIDQKLLGSRYCTGGYIFQVKDKNLGNLLCGPQYPDPKFDVFHGQGAPEVFSIALNQELVEIGEDVLVLGVGKVTRTSYIIPFHVRDNQLVKEFCKWDIEQTSDSLSFQTIHTFNNWQLLIKRKVTLIERTITSQTFISNLGKDTIPIRWFAHPFFPIPKDFIVCRFSMPLKLFENDGFFINNQGFFEMAHEYNWKKGLFQKIECKPEHEFSAIQCHPLVDKISVTCDYIPASLAIWANDKTFSFEPFYETQVEVNGERTWSIGYCV